MFATCNVVQRRAHRSDGDFVTKGNGNSKFKSYGPLIFDMSAVPVVEGETPVPQKVLGSHEG